VPVTSMRDFEFYGNDLILATHGRGFWILDDIGSLRQLSDNVTRDDAYLFKPSDAINYIEGGDNGTPLQKDEPQAANSAFGAAIDYYLKSNASGPVSVEIVDATGSVAHGSATTGRGSTYTLRERKSSTPWIMPRCCCLLLPPRQRARTMSPKK